MTTLLTLYLAGMPCAAVVLLWRVIGLSKDAWRDIITTHGLIAFVLWVVLWPAVLVLLLVDVWGDDE